MNTNNNSDWEHRLQELEAEVNSKPVVNVSEPGKTLPRHEENLQSSANNRMSQLKGWFNRLPNPGKIAVVAIAALVSFSILRTVLQLVTALISLAILGVVLYGVYQFTVKSKFFK